MKNKKKINIVYIYNVSEKYIGVLNKIDLQVKELQKSNIYTKKVNLYKNSINMKIMNKLPFIPNYSSIKLYVVLSKCDYDHVYIRKMSVDLVFLLALKNARKKKPEMKIMLEIPTYPYDGERKRWIDKFQLLSDKFVRKFLKKYVDVILTYSDDKEIFNIPTINLSNAANTKLRKKKPTNSNAINIIAVANFDFWHGYDRFIRGLKKYYENKGTRKIVLHLVGAGREIEYYKELSANLIKTGNVVFHGVKFGEDLEKLYDIAEIGLDAMGRHRSDVFYNSSLKGKEYGRVGLPIISGVKTELDYDDEFKYYFRVPASEDDINISNVIWFYDNIYYYHCDKEKIINEISRYTIKRFDVSVIWNKVTYFIKK